MIVVMLTRAPSPALRPFVQTLWATAEPAGATTRERVLPTGAMHVVIRLSEDPLRVFADADDPIGHAFPHAVIGGARANAYIRDVSRPIRSVGAQLHPGAAPLVVGMPADELAHQHTSLDDLFGTPVRALRQRLLETESLEERLAVFEAFLAARLPAVRGVQPVVAHALGRIAAAVDVGHIVRESGYSHRAFVSLFRRNVGLAPKTYARVHRFSQLLQRLTRHPKLTWAQLALEAGYSDQAHLSREFREIAGVSPTEYERLRAESLHHVPLHAGGQIRSRRAGPSTVGKGGRSTR
jgi:AraC-like DNA-binding protein